MTTLTKTFLLLGIIAVFPSCGGQSKDGKDAQQEKKSDETSLPEAQRLTSELFDLIDQNDAQLLSDHEFTLKSDSTKHILDSIIILLSDSEKNILRTYRENVIHEIRIKKENRDKSKIQ